MFLLNRTYLITLLTVPIKELLYRLLMNKFKGKINNGILPNKLQVIESAFKMKVKLSQQGDHKPKSVRYSKL